MRKAKSQNKPQDVLVTAVIVVSAAIAFMGGFVLSGDLSKSYYKTKNKTNVQENEDVKVAGATVAGQTVSGSTLGFNEKYIVSGQEYDYKFNLGTYAGIEDAYINLNYGNSKNEIVVSKYYYDNENNEEYTMNFNKPVVDVHMATFDMEAGYNTILFLLDDGTVEYMFAEDAINNDNYVTQGRIVGINNIVKFYEGTSCEKGTPICSKTTFAQTIDGKIFNLFDYIV